MPRLLLAFLLLLTASSLFGCDSVLGAQPSTPASDPQTPTLQPLATRTTFALIPSTPLPTRTPAPPMATLVPPIAVPRIGGVIVRAGPGVGFAQLGRLDRGARVPVFGKSDDSKWLQIPYPDANGRGWIAADFVDMTASVDIVPIVSILPPRTATPSPTFQPTATRPPAGTGTPAAKRTGTPPPTATEPPPDPTGFIYFVVSQGDKYFTRWVQPDKKQDGSYVPLGQLPADMNPVLATNAAPFDWSPPVNHFVFVSNTGPQDKLQVIDMDNTVVTVASHSAISSPRWSPDGRRIIYVGMDVMRPDGNYRNKAVYIVNADGTDRKPLLVSRNDETFRGLAWSKTNVIAFASNYSGRFEIWRMNPDGGQIAQMTRDQSDDSAPAWSPDGDKLAYVSNKTGPSDYRVYVMNVDGTGLSRLEAGFTPSFSPDGHWIAFSRNPGIYIMDLQGNNLSPLLAPGDHPMWAP